MHLEKSTKLNKNTKLIELKKVEEIKINLNKYANKEKAKILQNFFKTNKGGYGEGDKFIGVQIPIIRKIAKEYPNLTLKENLELLNSEIHEERMISTLNLVNQFEIAKRLNDEKKQKEIYEFYIKNSTKFNNWDFVDLSAPRIVGQYLLDKKHERKIMYKLSSSNKKGKNGFDYLWEKRIAIISTFTFIKNNEFDDTLKLAKIYLNENHNLMHKATGWMLREIGKRDKQVLCNFLDKHYKEMPRTMLRYSIEKFDETKRQYYLKK
ncbi:MAG: DNA alkylation repair protein [archaeon]|jgi:3-methyladenine DNA glycosylase AlkD